MTSIGVIDGKEGSLAKAKKDLIINQRKVLEELLGLIDDRGAMTQDTQTLLLSLLMDDSQVDELVRTMTQHQKVALKKLLMRDWGWISDFGECGGLDRLYGSEAKNLKNWAANQKIVHGE